MRYHKHFNRYSLGIDEHFEHKNLYHKPYFTNYISTTKLSVNLFSVKYNEYFNASYTLLLHCHLLTYSHLTITKK